MRFTSILPLNGFENEFLFSDCDSNENFITQIVAIHFENTDQRIKEATLAVYMAYRDHYPKYLNCLPPEQILQLNNNIEKSSPKVIKLRRIALSALAKVA